MTKRMVTACLILFLACGTSNAATVFSENFTGGAGHFSGFGANACQWQTPGDYQTFLSYFGNAYYAEITKTGCGSPTFWDQIISDTIDLSNYTNTNISFEHYYHGLSFTGLGNVEISTDGGSSYSTVYTTQGDVLGETETIGIPFADGEANVKIRFYFWYYGGVLFDSYWGVDNVSVTATPIGGDDDDNDDNDNDDNDDNDDDDNDDDITPQQPFIEVTSPVADDVWIKGATEMITWNQANPNGWYLRVALFKDGVYEGHRLCDNLPGNAVNCVYTVEQDILTADDYQVQVYFIDHGSQYNDFSEHFTITDADDDDTSPNGGDDDAADDDAADDDAVDDDASDDDDLADDDASDDDVADDDTSPNGGDDDASDDDVADDDVSPNGGDDDAGGDGEHGSDGDSSGECGC